MGIVPGLADLFNNNRQTRGDSESTPFTGEGIANPYQPIEASPSPSAGTGQTQLGDLFEVPNAPDYQQLTQDAFNTAVQPLRRGFEENLGTLTEQLAGRGTFSGQLGESELRKLLERQTEAETGLAGQLAAQFGGTAQQQQFAGQQAALNRRQQSNMAGLGLAREGILSGQGVQDMLRQQFGPGTTLTTQDQADLRRVALASGLNEDDYLRMRTAIGQGQLADVIANPQEYIQNPERARQFQLQLAEAARGSSGGGGGGLLGALGGLAGGVIGAFTGGPAGAAAGYQIGSGVGGSLG